MGKKTTKTSQTQNQNTSFSQQNTNPTWVSDRIEGLSGKIKDTFAGLDPYSLIAGPNGLQTQAAGAAAGLKASPLYGAAADIFKGLSGGAGGAAPRVDAASGLDGVGGFENRYTDNVVDTSLAGFDQNADLQRQQQQLDLAGDETFGGSGGSILRSLTEGQFARERGGLESGLRFGAQDRAFGLASADADRRQSASTANAGFADSAAARDLQARLSSAAGLAGVAGAEGAEGRANIDMLRQIEQARAGAPVAALGAEAGLTTGLPFQLFGGSTGTGSMSGTATGKTTQSGASLSDWLDFFKANAQAAAAGGA